MDGVRFVECEGRYLRVEAVAVLGHHLIGASHHAGRGLERASRRVLKGLARPQHGLLADDPLATTSSVCPLASLMIQ